MVGGFGPDEGVGVLVPLVGPFLYGGFEFFNGSVGASTYPFSGEFCEPAFDEVHPGAVGGSEMELESGMSEQPFAYFSGFVCGRVVQHYVNSEIFRGFFVDEVQEFDEFPRTVTRCHLGDDPTRNRIESRIQIRGATTFVVVCSTLGCCR